ncbi:GGDEF domain-containing protein [soil metagenome]
MRAAAFDDAVDKLRTALVHFDAAADLGGSCKALNTLGIVFGQSGDYAAALKTFLTLQRLCAELGEPEAAAEALNNTGIAYFHLGDLANALEHHLQALAAFSALQHDAGEVQALVNIGMVYFGRGRFEEAQSAFVRAQANIGAVDDPTRALLLNHLGRVGLALGQVEAARVHNEVSLALMNDLGDRLGASYTCDDLAAVYLKLGQVETAERYLLDSLAVKRETGDSKGEAETCLQLGDLYLHQNRLDLALTTLHEGLASAERSAAKTEICQAHRGLARAYQQAEQFREACTHLEHHAHLSRELFDRGSDLRLQALRVRFEVEQTEREKELYRLKNVELAAAVAELRSLTTSLQGANDEKEALLGKLEEQAREDALTGLYNRRYADRALGQMFAQARRYEHSLSVAVCDIDHFKRVNAAFSHQTGDVVLRRVADLLRNGVRSSDTVARYGGEEFVILFPETSLADAAQIVERICEAVVNHPWGALEPGLTVTLSAGVSADPTVTSHEKLLNLADKKLYEAKRMGKNQVRF